LAHRANDGQPAGVDVHVLDDCLKRGERELWAANIDEAETLAS
jgi:hypothetical protein